MPGSRAHIGRAPGVAVCLVLLLVSVGPASAREADDAGAGAGAPAPLGGHDSDFHRSRHPWVTVAWLTGSTQLDPQLADYQWDTSPRLSWGAQASLGVGRWGAGLRVWRAQTTQEIAGPGAPLKPEVRATTAELVGQYRVLEVLGTHLWASASVGRIHLGYHPDQVSIQPSGPGSTIDVHLAPIDEWAWGGGLGLEKSIRAPWSAGLSLDYQTFELDAAHRNGSVIEVNRERFSDWSARLALAWTYGRR